MESKPMQTSVGNGKTITLQKLVEDLKMVLQDGEQFLKSSAGQLREQAKVGARVTDEQIRRNPYGSIGAVFGLGLVAGILLYNLLVSRRA